MKTLYLLRHAKAEPGGKDTADRERVLSARGREACETVGAYMKSKRYIPDLVRCSPSARTRETLELVTQAAAMKPECRYENHLYLATMEEILRTVQDTDDGYRSAMVVGHNPGMHHISLSLAAGKRTKQRAALELKFPTCAFAVLQFDIKHWNEIRPGEGALADYVTPGEL